MKTKWIFGGGGGVYLGLRHVIVATVSAGLS